MKTNTLITTGLFVWIFVLGSTYFFDNINIDKCLDTGGSFNYSVFECDFKTTHNKQSYFQARAPRIIGISVAVIMFILADLFFKQKKSRREFKR